MLSRLRPRDRGFTLIELLVVIIIIGILAAIAIPAFLNQRQKASTATLKSDLKSAAQVITGSTEPGESWAAFATRTGFTRNSAIAEKNSGVTVTGRSWNDIPGVEQLSVSDGTFVEIAFVHVTDSIWTEPLPAGEFCIKGANIRSAYDKPWSAATEAKKSLYYDSRLGRIATLDELIDIGPDPQKISCYGFVRSWVALP